MTAATGKTPNYFMYFPGHYRWSADMIGILGTAPYGGAEIAEVDRVGRRLRDRLGDDEAWFREWRAGGDVLRLRAETAEAKGHPLTAASTYLRACSHYQHADHFRQPKDDQALFELYEGGLITYEDAGHSVVFEEADAFQRLMTESIVPATYRNGE